MIIYSIIPAKGNSKRIVNKNLKKINGKFLVEHSIIHSKNSKLIDKTFVSTDSKKIINIVKNNHVNYIKRPKKLCKTYSTSEDVIFHFLDKIKNIYELPDILVFLQPTSPFRKKNDLDLAIKKLINEKADSLFSSTIYKNHIWIKKNNKFIPINHKNDFSIMSQDKNKQFIDNGSFYIFKCKDFLKYKNRLFGKITDYLMPTKYSFQIDEVEDLEIIKTLMRK